MLAMSRKRVMVVTMAVMLSLFMASVEATVVATAMPTIVGQLGGLAIYSWVFSAYLVASTTTVPIYGKLSDLYGRRPIFIFSMALFLSGSALCGQATSMQQLIIFRALQGLGAGGLLPLAFIIIGDIFTFEERAKMQGVFSGVWGVSSITGPLLGGFLVDQVSWHWIFYINILPGILASALLWLAWQEHGWDSARKPTIDFLGAGILATAVITFLFGLLELSSALGWVLLLLAALLFLALLRVEQRAPDPILPLPLFRDRIFTSACAHGLFAGAAIFGSASFIPLFVQYVMEKTATVAGATLTPQLLGWVGASIIGSRMLLHTGYRTLSLAGMVLTVLGTFFLSQAGSDPEHALVILYVAMMGIGMGLSIPAFLIAVQSTVPRQYLGTATSTVQFSRSIGGALGVSVMGTALSLVLAARLAGKGEALAQLFNPLAQTGSTVLDPTIRAALGEGIGVVFLIATLAAFLGLAATAFAPSGLISELQTARGQAEPRLAGLHK